MNSFLMVGVIFLLMGLAGRNQFMVTLGAIYAFIGFVGTRRSK